MITDEYRKALVEVLEILTYLDEDDRKKIPDEIIRFYEDNKSSEYQFNINPDENIAKQKIMNKTREILAGIYVDYLCDSKDEKKEYIKKLKQVEFKYESQKAKKYDPSSIFKKNKTYPSNDIIKALVPIKKENIFMRILKKLKSLFSKKNIS